MFGACRECAVTGNKLDGRYANFPTGNVRSFYVSGSTFAHFGTGNCSNSIAIALNPVETDISPDTYLSNIKWQPTVAATARMRLGDKTHIIDHFNSNNPTKFTNASEAARALLEKCKKEGSPCECGPCDAVDYMRVYDTDGTTVGDVWQDGSAPNYGNRVIMSDTNPTITDPAKCRSDANTASIVCVNMVQVMVSIKFPKVRPAPPAFITVHKYGVEGPGGSANSDTVSVESTPGGERNETLDKEYNRKTYWTKGAQDEGCGFPAKPKIGAGFPVEPGLVYDIDRPVKPALQKVKNGKRTFQPEYMAPNVELTFQSNDPKECIVARFWMKEAKPVVMFRSGVSLESLKTLGTTPTVKSEAGTYVLNPQTKRLYVTMCQ